MADVLVTPVPDPGLGNTSWLVDLGDGRALAVDACRDLRALHATAERKGLRVHWAADTHLHADFLSGSRQLAADTGAQVLASRSGGRTFAHRGLDDGDEVDLGGLTLRALATPGHTDEHIAFLLLDGTRPLGVFTGGSLLAGAAARTDLVDPDRTVELALLQHHSLRRLAALPGTTIVWPTHGGGSFCSAAGAVGMPTTIDAEVGSNPALAFDDEHTFAAWLVATTGSHPPYFHRLGEINRRGPSVLPRTLPLPALALDDVTRLVTAGGLLVDVRPMREFAAGHPEGALSVPLRDAFASWLGWLAPHDRPLVVLRDPDQPVEELTWQAAKIGYQAVGEVGGGFAAWREAGLPVSTIPLAPPGGTNGRVLLDVRQDREYADGHVTAALHVELGRVAEHAAELAGQALALMCGHGERAMSAASVLARAGARDLVVVAGGPQDWPSGATTT